MLQNYKKQIGDLGEKYAENFLITQNYQILGKNFHSRFGEIDLIALENKFDTGDNSRSEIVFCEVKTRKSENFGLPEEAITQRKKNKIILTANYFLKLNKICKSYSWRIDVIALKLDRENKIQKIIHIKNI